MSGPPDNTGTSQSGYAGQWNLPDSRGEFNSIAFIAKQLINLMGIATLVQVKAVTGGGLNPVGTVDVQPMVNMLDGIGRSQQHGTIYGLPYFRLQGGTYAVVLDPKVDDIGLAVFADRDISSVKSSKKISNPGSRRRNSLSDGLYLGSFLGATPTQYVQFTDNGINITDKNGNTVTMDSSGITINGVLFDRSQNITNIKEATSQSSVTLTQHKHHQGNDSHDDTEQDVSVPFG